MSPDDPSREDRIRDDRPRENPSHEDLSHDDESRDDEPVRFESESFDPPVVEEPENLARESEELRFDAASEVDSSLRERAVIEPPEPRPQAAEPRSLFDAAEFDSHGTDVHTRDFAAGESLGVPISGFGTRAARESEPKAVTETSAPPRPYDRAPAFGVDTAMASDRAAEPAASKPPMAEELRYEGPITLEDDFYEDGMSEGSGRGLLTAGLIGVAVVAMIAIGIWLQIPSDGGATTNTDASSASAPSLTPGEQLAGAVADEALDTESQPELRPVPSEQRAELGAEDAPTDADAGSALAAGQEGVRVASRGLTDDAPSATVETSPSPQPPPIERPEPTTTRQTSPPVRAPSSATRETDSRTSVPAVSGLGRYTLAVRELVLAGQIEQAANESRVVARQQPPGSWTLQVMFACSADTVTRAFQNLDTDRLMVFPGELNGRACYRVVWDVYPTEGVARDATNEVPAYFDGRPVPKRLASLAD